MRARAVDYIHDRLDRTGPPERGCGPARSDFSRDGWFGNSGRCGRASALANRPDRARPGGSADFAAIVRTLCPAASAAPGGCNSAGCLQRGWPRVAECPHDHDSGDAFTRCAYQSRQSRRTADLPLVTSGAPEPATVLALHPAVAPTIEHVEIQTPLSTEPAPVQLAEPLPVPARPTPPPTIDLPVESRIVATPIDTPQVQAAGLGRPTVTQTPDPDLPPGVRLLEAMAIAAVADGDYVEALETVAELVRLAPDKAELYRSDLKFTP